MTGMIITKTIPTPLGDMQAGIYQEKLCLLEFDQPDRVDMQMRQLSTLFTEDIKAGEHPLFNDLNQQLNAYFSNSLKEFSIPLDLNGAAFQSSIWQLLLDIPYGETISYLDLAVMAGDPKKVRAVGRANGENRIAIIIPCHRVIGHDGKLVGYAGELWRKKKLLDMERFNSGKPVQAVLDF